MDFGEEDQRSEVPFSWHRIQGVICVGTRPTQPILMFTYPSTPCLGNTLPALTRKSTGPYQQHFLVLTRMFFSFCTWLKFSFHKAPFKIPPFMAPFLNYSISTALCTTRHCVTSYVTLQHVYFYIPNSAVSM